LKLERALFRSTQLERIDLSPEKGKPRQAEWIVMICERTLHLGWIWRPNADHESLQRDNGRWSYWHIEGTLSSSGRWSLTGWHLLFVLLVGVPRYVRVTK
jgi:hypothetical protein